MRMSVSPRMAVGVWASKVVFRWSTFSAAMEEAKPSMGAAVATLLSYLVILIARAVHSRSLLRVAWKVPRFVLAMGILLLQCVLVEWENTALALVCCLGILALYFRPLWRAWKTGIFTRR